MPHIFDPQHLNRLDNPERRELIPPEKTLLMLGLKEGDTFVDIGAGAGYFALPATRITGRTGRVIAADLSQEMLDHLRQRAFQEGAEIETILTPHNSLPIDDDTADMTFLAFVYHEIDDRSTYMAEIRRITKPSGTLAVVDWAKVQSPMGPPPDHRIAMKEALGEIASSGFQIMSHGMLNPYQYFITAR
ncbi:MAG: methyltransferase domain-containing protein [Bacteroidales bacterium]|jgi:ubiquinone/menaquinone biosynthesis C-methylase UbiE|nr:methyltransferase domain-containing protein [Bacteroidales bacterium]